MTEWSLLTQYPHFPQGDAKKYATRQALLIRLNQVESLWNRLKSAGLGVKSAKRMRTLPMETIDAAVSLAFLGFTGLATADQRQRRKIGPYTSSAATPVVIPMAVQPGTTAPAAAATPTKRQRRSKQHATAAAAVRAVANAKGKPMRVNGRFLPPTRMPGTHGAKA
jgi:hypothetical protein